MPSKTMQYNPIEVKYPDNFQGVTNFVKSKINTDGFNWKFEVGRNSRQSIDEYTAGFWVVICTCLEKPENKIAFVANVRTKYLKKIPVPEAEEYLMNL